ncbi:hypothetical protein [Candidatus Villigracilis saccharophilus]|uniref:hypothetical protein n=1 Tax=Candidatus Villigracilis saccharophilus TaxID=3140684 RepID=UPI00313559C1|nr:hypothetical protein [Anaerolineales bacterium]
MPTWQIFRELLASNNPSVTFSKVSSPAWLIIAANGALSGTPTLADVGSIAGASRLR